MVSDISIARDTMAKSLIDICQFDVTLPLTEKTRNIHTNSFIYFEPVPFMEDMNRIYAPMGATSSTRGVFYRKGYWYVKSVKITYNNNKQEMKLSLAPFPSVFDSQDMSSKTKATKTSDNKTSTDKWNNEVKLNPPSWLSKKDKEWAVRTVEKAIGTKKNELSIAKAVYRHFKEHYNYIYYADLRHTTPKGNREKAWNYGGGNCADGANLLETLMLTAGIKARIKHPTNHYIVKVTIDGKSYWVDNHRSRGIVTWNTVWHGRTSNSEANITNGEWING